MKKWLLGVAFAIAGCGARTDVAEPGPSGCFDAPITCVARNASDPCGASVTVDAVCNDTHHWSCPPNARPYARAAATNVCLPFSDPSLGISESGEWGLSSIVRLPTEDRCLWIVEDVKFIDGSEKRNVAFEPDLDAPFGTCPTTSKSAPAPIVTVEGGDDPSILVQIAGAYRLGGKTRVLYRLFRVDPSAVFGVTEMGGGIAHWDPQTGRIVVPSPSKPFPWGLDLDLGDAVIVAPDGTHAYAWGCTKDTPNFVEGCTLASIDDDDRVEVLSAPQFSSGPWISSVDARPHGFEHVYIEGFGRRIDSNTAIDLTGPWSKGPTLATCDLPAGDPKSHCAGPVVHPELADPTRPNERVVSYSIGSTGPKTKNGKDYWARLVVIP